MKSLITDPKNWLYPFVQLSFTGATIVFLAPYFEATVRWSFTFILLIYLFIQFRFVGLFSIGFSKVILLNILWAALTVVWSQVPLLSFMKVCAMMLVTYTFYYASKVWITRHYINQALDFFWLSVSFSILAAVLGLGSSRAIVPGIQQLYQGMVHGPNMLGSLMLMCVPLLAWKTYYCWHNNMQRLFWFGLLMVVFIFLFMSNSRAAIVGSLCCVISLVYSLGANKWIPIVATSLFLAISIVIISPNFYDTFVYKYVYKSSSSELGVFHTRKSPWEVSLNQAKLGGWIGGGYGVTIGDDSFKGGLTAAGYGREKGNVLLAIIEESGLIGLMLYIILIGSLYRYFLRAYILCKHIKLKVLLGILIGAITGMLFQSMFEAWWVAPGSPEFVYFWTLVGAGVGVCRLIELHLRSLGKKKEEIVS